MKNETLAKVFAVLNLELADALAGRDYAARDPSGLSSYVWWDARVSVLKGAIKRINREVGE